MANEGESDDDVMSPDDMLEWLALEVRRTTKAFELQVRDATDFATSYARGKIDADVAMKKWMRYHERWGGSPLGGLLTPEHMSDSEILEVVDRKIPAEYRDVSSRATQKSTRGTER
jgi:hypothetical protein